MQDETWRKHFLHLEAGLNPDLDELWRVRRDWGQRLGYERVRPLIRAYAARASSSRTSDADADFQAALDDARRYVLCVQAGHERFRLEWLPDVAWKDAALSVDRDEATGGYTARITRVAPGWLGGRLLELAARRIWEKEGHPAPPGDRPP